MTYLRMISTTGFLMAFAVVAASAEASDPATESVYSGVFSGTCTEGLLNQARAINVEQCADLADDYDARTYSVTHHENEGWLAAWAICRKVPGMTLTFNLRSTCNFTYQSGGGMPPRPPCGGSTGVSCP